MDSKDGVEKSRWLEIGSVWPHSDGKGFDVRLEAVPVDGRVAIRLIEAKPATGDTAVTA
jgi:hypothetical protein